MLWCPLTKAAGKAVPPGHRVLGSLCHRGAPACPLTESQVSCHTTQHRLRPRPARPICASPLPAAATLVHGTQLAGNTQPRVTGRACLPPSLQEGPCRPEGVCAGRAGVWPGRQCHAPTRMWHGGAVHGRQALFLGSKHHPGPTIQRGLLLRVLVLLGQHDLLWGRDTTSVGASLSPPETDEAQPSQKPVGPTAVKPPAALRVPLPEEGTLAWARGSGTTVTWSLEPGHGGWGSGQGQGT